LLTIRLPAFDTIDTVGARLLAIRRAGLLALDPVRPRLLALGAQLGALGPLRAGLLTLGVPGHAFRPLRPLDGGALGAGAADGLAFGTRSLCPGGSATVLDSGRGAVLATLLATRTCRGRN
jgi:hypothetical protein